MSAHRFRRKKLLIKVSSFCFREIPSPSQYYRKGDFFIYLYAGYILTAA